MEKKPDMIRTCWTIVLLVCFQSLLTTSQAQAQEQKQAQAQPFFEKFRSVAPLELVCLDIDRTHREGHHFNVANVFPEGILAKSYSQSWFLPKNDVEAFGDAQFEKFREQLALGAKLDGSRLVKINGGKSLLLKKMFPINGQTSFLAMMSIPRFRALELKGVCTVDFDSKGIPTANISREAPKYLLGNKPCFNVYSNGKDRAQFVSCISSPLPRQAIPRKTKFIGYFRKVNGKVMFRPEGFPHATLSDTAKLVTTQLDKNGWDNARTIDVSAQDGRFLAIANNYAVFLNPANTRGLETVSQLNAIDFEGNRWVLHKKVNPKSEILCKWHGDSFFVSQVIPGRSFAWDMNHSRRPPGVVVEYDANNGEKLRTIKPPAGSYRLVGNINVAKDGTIFMHGIRALRKGELPVPETRIEQRRNSTITHTGRFAILRCPPGGKEFQLLAEIPSVLRKRAPKNLVESDGYIYFGDRAPDFLYPEGTLDAEMGEAIYRLPLTFKTKRAKVERTYN